jgi:hypothetical protein
VTDAPGPTCSDLLAVFARACETGGRERALEVVKRFGAQYAATIPPQHYATAIEGLKALIVHSAGDPAAVKAGWTKKISGSNLTEEL